MNCSVCQKEAKNAAGLAAHMRSHKQQPPQAEPEAPPVIQSAVQVLKEMKGWKAKSNGAEHFVIDATGKRVGNFPTEAEAVRFLENSNRWIR